MHMQKTFKQQTVVLTLSTLFMSLLPPHVIAKGEGGRGGEGRDVRNDSGMQHNFSNHQNDGREENRSENGNHRNNWSNQRANDWNHENMGNSNRYWHNNPSGYYGAYGSYRYVNPGFSYYGTYPDNYYNTTYNSPDSEYYDNKTDEGVYFNLR